MPCCTGGRDDGDDDDDLEDDDDVFYRIYPTPAVIIIINRCLLKPYVESHWNQTFLASQRLISSAQ